MPRRRTLLAAGMSLSVLAGCGIPGGAATPTTSAGTVRPTSPGPSPSPVQPPASAPPSSSPPSPSPPSPSPPSPSPPPTLELPRGGTRVFPRYRLVGFVGYPGTDGLGRLGIGKLSDAVAALEKQAQPYAVGRRVLPVLELIATIAHASPGRDGRYRGRAPESVIETFLRMARTSRSLLLLNIQPGRARFIDEVHAHARWLQEPDVGLALDPEWAVGPGQVPGRVFGSVTGRELDEVARFCADIVRTHHLPEKVIVYHELSTSIVRDISGLHRHRGIAMVVSVDGIGTRAAKTATWQRVVAATPSWVHPGFKLFFSEDRSHGPLMTPAQVLALRPRPEYVMYE